MSKDIKAKFRRIVDEAWNKGNLDSLDELHSASYVEHRPPLPDVTGLDAFKQMVAGAHQTFPDFHITIDELILEGDKLAVRFSWTGTKIGKQLSKEIFTCVPIFSYAGEGSLLCLQGS